MVASQQFGPDPIGHLDLSCQVGQGPIFLLVSRLCTGTYVNGPRMQASRGLEIPGGMFCRTIDQKSDWPQQRVGKAAKAATKAPAAFRFADWSIHESLADFLLKPPKPSLSACLTPEVFLHTSRTIVSNLRLRHLDQCSMPVMPHAKSCNSQPRPPGSIRDQC